MSNIISKTNEAIFKALKTGKQVTYGRLKIQKNEKKFQWNSRTLGFSACPRSFKWQKKIVEHFNTTTKVMTVLLAGSDANYCFILFDTLSYSSNYSSGVWLIQRRVQDLKIKVLSYHVMQIRLTVISDRYHYFSLVMRYFHYDHDY